MLTPTKKKVINFVNSYSEKRGYSPTLEEIRKGLKLSSISTVHQHVKELEKAGHLKKISKLHRSIEVPKNELVTIPLKGYIAAGQPIEAVEEHETIDVPKNILSRSGKHYALKVVGDSMIEEGIFNGDTVIVRSQSSVENGETAVALINDNEVTLKKIYKEKNRIKLQPANPRLKPFFTKNILIQGKVISTIRNFEELSDKFYFKADNVRIYKDDILKIDSIPNGSVDLIITSPPYNVDIHYNSHNDNLSYEEYLEFTKKWIQRCYDLAKSEGRFLLNIPLDKNKGGQKSVGADFTRIAKEVGWKYHSTIVWNEGNISRRTAWGSFMSASAPYVIAPVELILVLYKDSWKKTGGSRKNDITKKEFMDWTNGVWTFNGQSKKGAGGHPAPFPIELPRRCIKLFSFVGDTVLDPFLGSGSTLIAAHLHDRKGIGIEIDQKYCDIAIDRIKKETNIHQSQLV